MKNVSWKLYKKTIENFGFAVSLPKFLLWLAVIFGLIIGAALIYRINPFFIPFICILCAICCPFSIKAKYKALYEEKRFTDLSQYMEQICSSFSKTPKILFALEDAAKISDGKLKAAILKAVEHIDNGIQETDDKNIYEEAFEIIENEYSCKRLNELHRYLVKVEVSGGRYKAALDILQKDIHAWVERTFLSKKDKANVSGYYAVGIVLSLCICSMALFFRSYVDITIYPVYSLVSSIFLFVCVLSYTLVQRFLSGSWLEKDIKDSIIEHNYNIALNLNVGKRYKKLLPLYIVLFVSCFVLFFLELYIYFGGAVAIAIIFLLWPILQKKSAWNNTIKEIERSFPEWIRDVSVNMQHQTVQMSIQESYVNAPVVIKKDLELFIKEVDENPTGVEPYFNFMSAFNLTEISSSMKLLYSFTELGSDGIEESLISLMDRSYILLDKAEKDEMKTKKAFLDQLVSLPLFFSAGKMFFELFLLLDALMALTADPSSLINW